ncbi:hypothetical protein [Mucilaginibacter sp.]|uniref:hypothetical protein n=1 Tax=Mucilaginibacter sp. TaxID=1882438 RepID=UPI003265F64D
MNERLSLKYNLFQKIILAVMIWFVLSLPSPVAIFEYVVIKTDYDLLNLLQRAIHFSICLFISFYIYRDRIVLEYNATSLIVIDKRNKETYTIPLSRFTAVKLKQSYVKSQARSFEITYLTANKDEETLTFKAYSGKKINKFIEALKSANPNVDEKYWSFY